MASESSLPAGWTEHTAPSGHKYYYHADTKKSTYTRPEPIPSPAQPVIPPHAPGTAFSPNFASNGYGPPPSYQAQTAQSFNYQPFPAAIQHFQSNQTFHSRREPQDRPKTRHPIPGHAPWLLVKTRLRRRFVHNPETGESFWKPPKELLAGLIEFDIQERNRAEGKETTQDVKNGNGQEEAEFSEAKEVDLSRQLQHSAVGGVDDEEDYEEIEIVEEDDEEDGAEFGDSNPSKRLRTGSEAPDADGPVEFTEDDIAAQLAAMGESYADDYDEEYYADETNNDGDDENNPQIDDDADAEQAFHDLLDDFNINPFAPFSSVIDAGAIISDDRYTFLPTMRARQAAFDTWSASRAADARARRAALAAQDPRTPFLAFLHIHATPKLFWPEFRRKHKREPELKSTALADRDREKLYREHIRRTTKLAEDIRRSDLKTLLGSITPSSDWHRDIQATGDAAALPAALTSDVRWISLPTSARDSIVTGFVSTLPPAEDILDAAARAKHDADLASRRKRDDAVRQRQRQVDEEDRRRGKDERAARAAMHHEQHALRQAMNVGRAGLKASLQE